jgi:hypothetical protein
VAVRLYPEGNRLDRMEALRLYTVGSSWFSSEEGKKGSIAPDQLADFSVLSPDYFSIPEEQIKHLESVLTVVGGRVVFAAGEFERLDPPPLPVSPDWSPIKTYDGYAATSAGHAHARRELRDHVHALGANAHRWVLGESGLWALGCDCFAFQHLTGSTGDQTPECSAKRRCSRNSQRERIGLSLKKY